jgi:excisionase family DNA binding protein
MTAATGVHRAFYSVGEAAELLGMCDMTLYRAIRDGQFPAVRIRGRLIIPARVIEAIANAAVDSGTLVDVAEWVEPQVDKEDRPRPGANQSGAGSFSTQHRAGYGEDATSPVREAGFGGAR